MPIVLLFLLLAVFCSRAPGDGVIHLAFALRALACAGSFTGLWLVSAFGLGRLWRPLFASARRARTLQFACGLATALWLAHLLGWLGISTTFVGAFAPFLLGAALVVVDARTLADEVRKIRLPPSSLFPVAGVSILLLASASLPGWLWESEANGYDVLSYHLRLPEEWLGLGRLQGLQHNFFSFMPSYVEAAYLEIAAIWGSMQASNGLPMLCAQFLQAWLAVLVAGMIAVTVSEHPASDCIRNDIACAFGAACFVLTPWVQVTGSLAYDEMAVCALLTGALVAANEEGIPVGRRGVLTGWLVGAALCAKLTSALLGAPIVLLLLIHCSFRWWPRAAGAVATGIALALAPYATRNFVATGNPVFPFATSLLGMAHWQADQFARWHGAFGFEGTLAQKLAAAWREAVVHPQWAGIQWLIIAAIACGLAMPAVRRATLELGSLILLGAAAWFVLTPKVTRYLIPLLVPGSIVCGIVAGELLRRAQRSALVVTVCLAVVVVLSTRSIANFESQRGGNPLAFVSPLAFGLRSGRPFIGRDGSEEEPPMTYFVNFRLPPQSLVYVIGEARMLYVEKPVAYFTAWDRWWLADLVHAYPDDPARWARSLADRGVTHIWVNDAELQRMWETGLSDPAITVDLVHRFVGTLGPPVARSAASTLYALVPSPETDAGLEFRSTLDVALRGPSPHGTQRVFITTNRAGKTPWLANPPKGSP